MAFESVQEPIMPASAFLPAVAERQAATARGFDPWRPRTLYDMLVHAAERHPDRPYLITDTRTWTYRQMADWAASVAGGRVTAGVRPDEHVALVMANYPAFTYPAAPEEAALPPESSWEVFKHTRKPAR